MIQDFLNRVFADSALEILQQLPDESVDLTVTSPPYNKQGNTYGWLVRTDRYSNYRDRVPEEEYQSEQVDILNEVFRATKPGGSLFYNHKVRWSKGQFIHPLFWLTSSDWHIRQEIIWDRILAANVRGWRFWQVDERVYWLYKPIGWNLVGDELESRHAKMTSVWRMKPATRRENHPSPFPIELPTRAIYSLLGSEGRKVVLDPYCGIGTTLVAAKLLGHDYIGIDMSPEYVEYANERLDRSDKEREQVETEKEVHVVKDSFKSRKERGTVSWPFAPEKPIDESESQSNREDT